jgi:predicted Zn finger-like uncharacterized protein
LQAQCPQCSTRFQLPDEKVPDRPFKVRCPKCQNVVALPGKGDAAATPSDEPAPAAPAEEPKPAVSAAPPSPPRREHTGSEEAEDALIALADAGLAEMLTSVLGRLDYNVDVVEDVEEGTRLLEQGAYALAVTSRGNAAPGGPMTLAQRMLRLTPDPRRRVFVVLVSEDFGTADGTQAWAAQADLVLNPRDAEGCENAIRSTLTERKRLYQPYLDARRRIETE